MNTKMTELKIFVGGFNSRLATEYGRRLIIWRHINRKCPMWNPKGKCTGKKWTEHLLVIWQFHTGYHSCNWSPQKWGHGRVCKNIFEEIIVKIVPKMKLWVYRSKKFNKLQAQETCRKLHCTTWLPKTNDKQKILKAQRNKDTLQKEKQI